MRSTLLLLPFFALACAETTEPTDVQEQQRITTIEATIDGAIYTWADPENDGLDIQMDPITLPAASDLPIQLRFFNEQQAPAVELTERFQGNADTHQVFFDAGDLASYAYGDEDSNGLPLGLDGTLTTSAPAAGDASGTLRIVVRHMATEDGENLKVAGIEDTFYAEGDTALPGRSGADVTFDLTIDTTL